MRSALSTLDHQRIRTLIQGPSARRALRDSGFIFKALQTANASAQTEADLLKVWSVVDVLATTNLCNDNRLSISAQRCVIELQSRAPFTAARVARQALDRGLVLYPQTILATVSKAWERAHTLADLDAFVSLFDCALRKKRFDLSDRQTIGQCDALLGALCDPSESPRRISSEYKDKGGLIGVSNRMLLGARLAKTVIETGLAFNHERNRERMSLTIRALASIGALASLQAWCVAGEVHPSTLANAAREMRLPFDTFEARDEQYDREAQAQVGPKLLRAALDLAHHSFGSDAMQDGSIRTYHRYVLRGATIASLFRELERSKLELGNAEREAVAVIGFCALEMESKDDDHLRPATLNSALGLLVKRPKDQPDDAETAIKRALCVANLLARALPRITEVSFLEAAMAVFGAAFEANPDGVDEYTSWHDAIGQRVNVLQSERSNRSTPSSKPHRSEGKPTGWFSKLMSEGERR